MDETGVKNYDLPYLERQVDNLTKLVNINGIINSTLDIKALLKIIMEIIKDIMDAEASTMLLYEEKTNDLVFKVALGEAEDTLTEKYRVGLGQGVAGWVAEHRKPIYVNDVYNDRRFDSSYDKRTGYVTRSILCAPLLFKGKLLGVIQAINPNNRPGFDDEDMRLFRFFADQCALAVQNAIFFQNALEEERIKTELSSARTIQESLIPEIDEHYENIHIAARSSTAREVGGEFHGLYSFGDRHIGISLGDIHEKGVPGAIKAAILSGAVTSLSSQYGKAPATLARRLYRAVADERHSFGNVSVFYAVVDLAGNRLQFVNAGIAYPILVRNHVARYLRFGRRSLEELERETKMVSVLLQPGDFFIILTDGILNIRSNNGQQMGLKRVMDFLQGDFRDSREVIEGLFGFAGDFSGERGRKEDISVIAMQVE